MVASRRPVQNEIAEELIDEAERLSALGYSLAQISVAVGLGQRTISRIRAGKHISQLVGRRYQSCPACGHRVLLPCRICAARAAKLKVP